MKSTLKIFVSALALAVMASTPALRAQDTTTPSTPPPAGGQGGGQRGGRGGRGMMTPDQRVAAIDAAVKLTDEQKPKVLAIVTDSQKEMQDARGAAAGDRQAMMAKMQEINKKASDAIKALLTPDQQKAFDAMPQMGGRRGGGGGKKGGGGGGGN